ncbi:flagellin, partial [Aeromonas rivipollensis]|uniref:flagellin n=1 Tax=Aeromonas rivipollensis TaxID=948519 RepID=UPI0038D1C7B4
MMQTAEGAMDEMTNIVQRMKDLATQGANGTNNADDLSAMNKEFGELQKELKNITDNTTFGGTNLLKTKFAAAVDFQVGGKSAEKVSVDVKDDLKFVTDVTVLAAPATALDTQANAVTAMGNMDTLLDNIGKVRSAFGANINRLEHTVNNLSNMKENTDMANGRIMDADFAQESTNMTKNQMLMQAGMSVLSNSNQMTGMVTSLLR